ARAKTRGCGSPTPASPSPPPNRSAPAAQYGSSVWSTRWLSRPSAAATATASGVVSPQTSADSCGCAETASAATSTARSVPMGSRRRQLPADRPPDRGPRMGPGEPMDSIALRCRQLTPEQRAEEIALVNRRIDRVVVNGDPHEAGYTLAQLGQ